jgi:hypothetical protein
VVANDSLLPLSAPPHIKLMLSRSHSFNHSRGRAPRFARRRSTCGRYSATNAARNSGRGPCGPDDDITVGADAVAVVDVAGGDGGVPSTSACKRALARLLAPVRPSPKPGIPGSGGTQELPQRHPAPHRHWAPRHASPHRSPPPLPLLPRRAVGTAATRAPTGATRRVRRAHSDCGGRSRSRTTTSAPAVGPPPLALLLVPLAAALGVICVVTGAVSPPTGSASACHWKSWHGRPRKFSTWRRARSVR